MSPSVEHEPSAPGLLPATKDHYTLFLKNGKKTVLLYALPNTPLTTVKADLLSALRASGVKRLNEEDESTTLPESSSDIEIAVPAKPNQYDEGWNPIVTGDEGEKSKGKGKALAKDDEVLTVKSAKLKDNAVLAFRFRSAKNTASDDDSDFDDLPVGGWDVQIPTLDYGEDSQEQE